MKDEIKYFVFAIALGMTLTGYAHMTFATKEIATIILDRLISLESKIDRIILNEINKP